MKVAGSQGFEAYLPPWAKGKGIGVWGFKGKDNSSQEDENKCEVKPCK